MGEKRERSKRRERKERRMMRAKCVGEREEGGGEIKMCVFRRER